MIFQATLYKARVFVGEWLHILSDWVLPIPAFAKGGEYIGTHGNTKHITGARIVEGRDIYYLSEADGVNMETAKMVAIGQAKREITHNLLAHAGGNIDWSVIRHGTKNRVYFEVLGRLAVENPRKNTEH